MHLYCYIQENGSVLYAKLPLLKQYDHIFSFLNRSFVQQFCLAVQYGDTEGTKERYKRCFEGSKPEYFFFHLPTALKKDICLGLCESGTIVERIFCF